MKSWDSGVPRPRTETFSSDFIISGRISITTSGCTTRILSSVIWRAQASLKFARRGTWRAKFQASRKSKKRKGSSTALEFVSKERNLEGKNEKGADYRHYRAGRGVSGR